MATKKYKLGVAFSGGGAKAAAHCGALQALHEFGLKPEIVSGTSAGALVAIFYSCGFSPREIVSHFLGMNFFKDIVSPGIPRGGMFDSKPLLEYLRKILPYTKLEELPIPTYIVASDMEHGVAKVFSRGEIAPRAVASCSIPVIFNPISIGGVHYVDGGAFQNLPVPAIRSRCETLIAFNLNHIYEEKYKNNVAAVAYRSFSMMFMSNTVADARQADVFVDLDTEGCTAYDMTKLEELFFRGYASTVKALEANGYERQMEPQAIEFPSERKTSRLLASAFSHPRHRSAGNKH